MGSALKKVEEPATYEDLCALPDHLRGEIIAGTLYAAPRPAIPHVTTTSDLGGILFGEFQRTRGPNDGWWFMDEPELHLGRDILVPDIAGWRKERMPKRPREPYITLAPDWVCEVASPSTARSDRLRKMPAYAEHGVEWLWLIDPIGVSLEIFELVKGRWTIAEIFETRGPIRPPPFDAIEMDLAELCGVDDSEPEDAAP